MVGCGCCEQRPRRIIANLAQPLELGIEDVLGFLVRGVVERVEAGGVGVVVGCRDRHRLERLIPCRAIDGRERCAFGLRCNRNAATDGCSLCRRGR